MNIQLFKYFSAKNGDTMTSIAKALGIGAETLSRKLHGKSDFTRAEIKILAIRWQLHPQDTQDIFLDKK